MLVVVTHKNNGHVSTVSGNKITLSEPSIVKLALSPRDVSDFQRAGEDLLIHLHNGTTIRIVNFYKYFINNQDNDLVLEDSDGKLWAGHHSDGLTDFNFAEIQSVDQLVEKDRGILPILLGLGGLGAIGAAVAGGSGGGGDRGPGGQPGESDHTPPEAPVVKLENDTGIVGDGITKDGNVIVSNLEAGATWEYSIDGGKTWQKGTGNSFELAPGDYENGDVLVRQIDQAGNISSNGSLGEITVDVTAPGAEFVLSDPEGDNIPTATGTTEPNSDVTVTWPDGTQTQVTADGSGEWSATAPGVQPDGDVSVVVTDPAGNSGTGNESWTADDITPPDTSGTTVSVGTIAGDGVVNASEAAGSVAITVTIANPPSDAATTAVNVLVDGVPYAATNNGDGTWTASVPGSALAGATTPTVTAEAVFTDAAGNAADPVTGSANYSVDVTAPGADFVLSDPDGDNIPTATGTTEPNSDVTVTWPDGTQTQVTADGSGEWSATAPGVQPDGDVSVVVTDPAGNSGTGNESWTADDITPPDTSGTTVSVGTIAGDGVVNASEAAGSVAITVTIANPPSDAATTAVNVLVDGVPYAATNNGDGTWTASVPGSALAGATTPTVTAEAVFTDAAGNAADPVTGSANYSVDVTAPGADFVLSDPDGDNIPTATGTTEPNSDVTVTWPDGTQTQVTADGSGEWSATAPGVQPDGDVSVVVTDPAGNSGTGNESWTADDITPPDTSGTTVSVGTIAGDGVINASEAAGSVAITVTIANPPSDAATTAVKVLVDGVPYAATANGDGTWTASVPGSALAGATTPTVTAEAVFTDAAGNAADPVTGSANYSVDVTAPGADFVLSDPDGDNIPTATGTTEPNSDVTVTWPDGTQTQVTADGSGEWSATAPGVQPDGDVSVVVTDPAGNSGTGNESWTADDITPPDTSGTTVSVGTIAGDGVVNASEAAGSVAITVTIANPPADAATTAVNVLVDGVPYAATANGDGTWTASVPGSALAGATTPTVTAEAVFTDAAGNAADPVTGSANYSVDVTAPGADFVLSDPDGDNIPTATGTTEPNSDVTVTWPDGTQTQVTADGSGEWSATAPGVQPDGDVSVVVTDPAGNSGTGNESWTADDITPPDTSGTTVSVGTIAGDGVINASEAAGSVAITVTIANPPSDAATTAVNVLVDGVPYAATANGDGTWTASVPGSALAGATTPTVTAEAVFTDAAGNAADPVTGSANYSVDVTAPGADFVLSDPDGDNIPTATGTTEPNSDVTVTWPDGTQTQVTADGSGEWSATAPGVQPDGDVSVVVTDPAGNSGTGNESWTADDITPPDTSGTTVSVGTIAGDGVINASEAAGSVAITVTIANPPSDAATTAVKVLVDGVPYAATANGDGTWTASVPGSALAGATTPTVTAEAVFTDAAGNAADPVTGSANYSVDVTAPGADFVLSDPDGDNIPTATGTTEPNSDVTVTWPDGTQTQVTADGSGEWSATAPGVQPDGDVSVVVTDPAGNSGTGNESWTADDITPPDTSGTTVSVGTIAGDGVINASEAAGSVAITVTIANPPSDAATTAVNVLVDGVPYAATNNGDGTWTASVPGSALAGATTPTVTAEAVFTDAAGNAADPVTGSANYSVDVTAPGADFVLSDPDGDNIPTATGTTEPNSDVTVTWPDGTQTQVTADGSGEWSATAPGVQPDGDVSVVVTDPAGNSGTGNESWTADDITPPDTSGTTVSVGTIAGDGVVNASEAAGSVAITVTIANPPADAATTAVNVLVDGVPYAATANGDGTWTASVPGSALAGATTPTVTAEAVFTDAAGNAADPVTGSANYSVDVTAPGAPALELANDTGVDGDGISSVGTVTITNLESGAQWEYSTDNGVTWNNGTGTSFVLPQGDYAAGAVQVRQTDSAGNTGTAGSLGATSIISLQGANDAADADMGTRESVTHAPVSDENLQLLGLLDNGSQAAGISFTVGQGSTGDIVIQVSQNALIAVADAFNVEIYDAAGNLVHVLTTGNDPLVGDVLGTGILGLTGDNTLVANITGLAPGEYKVVVRKGESALGTLLDADGNGVSLQELGQGGVVLGQENQALVLAAIENALNGALLPGLNLPLGTVVKNILLPVLDTTTALGAGDLVEVLSNSLNALGLSHLLDQVLGAVAHALLNNTLTLIQDTSVSVSLTEHSFADGDTPVSGNVIDPDINADGEAGEDQVVPGTKVTQIENSDGEVIQLNNGSATIEGNHGTLVINADGSYTYTPNGSPASVGQSDTFSYTISDGTNSTTANLTINIDGALVTNDTAQAGIEYEYLVTAGVNMNDAINDSWALTLFPRERTSASLTVAQNTTQDVTLTIDAGNLLGLGGSVVVYVEVRTPGTNIWTSHATYSSSQLLSLLGSGGPGKILVPDLDAGEYRIRTITTGVGVAGSFSVDITSEVTHLDQYAPNPHAFSAHGDLFANDLVGADIPPLSISHDGTTFTNVVSGTPQVVQGAYGSLQINADGTYTYTPDSRASVGGEYTDTFTYRIEHNGTYQEATLTVTINTTVQGDTVDSGAAMVAFSIDDADVVPMNDLLADADDTPAGQDHNMADLLQDFALDDGSNDVTLPFSDTMSDEFEPASIFTENLTAPLTTTIPEDPLAHLVLDPLIKDDDLHSMHIA